MRAYLSISRHKQVACLFLRSREWEEYAGFESGSAEVVNVKTGVDSVSKQVETGKVLPLLLGSIQTAAKRRYVAGNGAYIRFHANTDRPPQMITGSTMKSAAGKTQCVLNSQPGLELALQYRASIRYTPGRVREVR